MRALDALRKEHSVSGAAKRLGLSRPTLSAFLSRLRRHFADDLLGTSRNQYILTPLASASSTRFPRRCCRRSVEHSPI
ncbi:LysR family transcriptional regulator [Nonomuraea sp. NPDC050783]|uniref:helix-turn-helix domain-containing protein n=1 Tax=Nonomuraea sp. NPDC050783 TaxID=3154634 RepID=UPI003465776F